MRNGMLKGKRLRVAFLVIGLIALLLFTGCAPVPPGEEKKVVRIGYIAPLTGPPAAVVQVGFRNLIDYLKYFEEVGVPGLTLPPGITIELVWGDSGMDVPRAIGVYERMCQDVVFFQMPSPVEAHGLKSRLERDGIGAMCMSVDEQLMYPAGQIFTVIATESERFALVCDWIMENWEEERPPRVGMIGTETPSGHAAEVMGTAYAKSIGIEMLPFEVVPWTPLDTTPQLLRLREERADFIYLQCLWATVLPIMRDADRLGLIGKVRFGGGSEDSLTIPLLELGPTVEGFFSAKSEPWYEDVPILWDILRQYEGRIDTSGSGACTLLYVPVPIEAIRIAIEKVGYENLDGRAVKEAFYSIKNFDPHQLGRPVTYTREDNRGAPALKIYQVQSGKVVPVSDWIQAPMLVP